MPSFISASAGFIRAIIPGKNRTAGIHAPGKDSKPALHRPGSPGREYLEVLVVIAVVTAVGWYMPFTYHVFGHIYFLAVILLSLRVSRWPALFAAVVSASAWNYVFIPPRLSFHRLDFDADLTLGTYFVVALIAGQLMERIRRNETLERERQKRATALFQLTRVLAGAHTLDEAVESALRQAEELFHARTALLIASAPRHLTMHPAGSFLLDDCDRAVAEWVWRHGREAGRFTPNFASVGGVHLPILRAATTLGVLALHLPAEVAAITPAQRELMEAFAAQIALLIEREKLRAASEREKLFQESDRLHRTLLDSVSHELKTPLAVLHSAAEKFDTDDARKRAALAAEIRIATGRLDHLVANLLNQTRLETGGLRPQLDWCDARDIVGAARRAAGTTLSGHPLTLEIPPDLPLVMADAPLMEQVLANLLLNAALHTPAATPIVVRAGVEPATTRFFLAVSDRGPGIPPELLGSLFRKFRRGPGARAGGLGLGLSIVKGFMLAQGGGVAANNNPDGGAAFTVYLPHLEPDNLPNEDR